jgi:hypothetical protein
MSDIEIRRRDELMSMMLMLMAIERMRMRVKSRRRRSRAVRIHGFPPHEEALWIRLTSGR